MRFTLQDGFVIYPAQVDIQSKGLTHAGKWTFTQLAFLRSSSVCDIQDHMTVA
ncbi:hypothetical protein PHLCEN_2v223 [Hermanssonia centrifuga]|uniref:Uncharacterized protein n=1 Tax=Hermanssonia centrifuga TaxID=98765 RepID=A0A2R6S6K9_9APHY|nr:hypothetical protein PHLCEN_2v223 [Hermanssonia centrifuga]